MMERMSASSTIISLSFHHEPMDLFDLRMHYNLDRFEMFWTSAISYLEHKDITLGREKQKVVFTSDDIETLKRNVMHYLVYRKCAKDMTMQILLRITLFNVDTPQNSMRRISARRHERWRCVGRL